jgi:hypothetical protein
MSEITREKILDNLEQEWGTYVERFDKLTPGSQKAFLQQQGYARFADLLAHVAAWWQQADHDIEAMLEDPLFKSPDEDVDAFNAQAVENVHPLDEKAVEESFENMRQVMLDLVIALPDEAFQKESFTERFDMEVIGHLEEHRLP